LTNLVIHKTNESFSRVSQETSVLHAANMGNSINVACGVAHLIDCYKVLLQGHGIVVTNMLNDRVVAGAMFTYNYANYERAVLKKVVLRHPLRTVLGILKHRKIATSGRSTWRPEFKAQPWLISIFVDKAHRGRSLASTTLAAGIESIRNEQFKSLYLETEINNQPAIDLYQKYQFSELGRQHAILFGKTL